MSPVVLKKAMSLELLQTYEPPCARMVTKKRISAPLAKQESITDSEVKRIFFFGDFYRFVAVECSFSKVFRPVFLFCLSPSCISACNLSTSVLVFLSSGVHPLPSSMFLLLHLPLSLCLRVLTVSVSLLQFVH